MSAPSPSIAAHAFNPSVQGPLAGVRVLDLTRLVAGNMLTLQLADFGADVINRGAGQNDRNLLLGSGHQE